VENSLEYALDRLRPGLTVLDLGCGPGTITAGIARLVAPGRVIAADLDPGILDQAADHVRAQGLTNVDCRVMDGYALGLPDDSVDFAHAHQVLQHVSDPVAVLRELARVTRPGGTVAVRDSDYGAFAWYPPSPGLDQWRTLYCRAARANGGEPDAGRHLLAWAHAAGLADPLPGGSVKVYTGDQARWWADIWAERIRHSAVATQLLDAGWATPDDLQAISAAWRAWGDDPDAWFSLPNGQLIATVR
jgi:SAM-dependent methyltransferase